ncbi:MAG: DUF424 family protein, partial [Candidatus Methanomethylophilaceae archaeon]|nr:DUF424 family protein [Candidatus Methanomethylophilaceae archaeon]
LVARLHQTGDEVVLAVCDEDVIGMTLEGGGRRMTVHEAFYKGTIVDEETVVEWMRSAGSMNIVGNEAVEVAVRAGYAEPEQAFEIGGVKYLVVVVV